jgi:flavin reductase (DIM6/NTAB) family NADH-FMN oxidoreductase RutF
MPDVRLFDSRDLRRVLGTFVTGVTVVTTTDDEGGFHGVTANSFSSVSLDPPLVLWSQAVKSHSHPVFFKAERFAVNILAEDQIELSNRFAKSSQEKFAGIDVDIGSGGVPLLRGCSARLECRVVSRVPGGDHTIYVGEVHAIDRAERKPLVFGNGQYLLADPHDLADRAPSPDHKQAQLSAMRLGTRAIERLVGKFDETMALAVWGPHGPTITHWEPASAPVSEALPVGLILPATSTATGLAFAAHLPAEAVAQTVWPDQAATSEDDDWNLRLEGVRRRGTRKAGDGNLLSQRDLDQRAQCAGARCEWPGCAGADRGGRGDPVSRRSRRRVCAGPAGDGERSFSPSRLRPRRSSRARQAAGAFGGSVRDGRIVSS